MSEQVKVRALTSFVGRYGPDNAGRMVVSAGDEFELPEGVDWVTCGFCEVIEKPQPRKRTRRQATRQPKETSVQK